MDANVRRYTSLVLLMLMLGTTTSVEAQWRVTPEALIGLDHMPVVVQDLDAATLLWRDLGFAVQPGETLDNGITTAAIVFKEGAGITLLSVPAAVDELTAKYRAMLEVAEGPAAFFFRSKDLGAARNAMGGYEYNPVAGTVEVDRSRDRDSLNYLSFREGVPDESAYRAHPNGARVMSRVWVATTKRHGKDLQELLMAVSGDSISGKFYAPDDVEAISVAVDNGEVLILPIARQVTADRPVVGATIEVENVERVRSRLERAGVPYIEGGTFGASIVVTPDVTHGMWVEFRE